MPTSDVLLPDDIGVALKLFAVGRLLDDDVDKINGLTDVVLDPPPQFSMSKVMSKSTCVIFSKMIFR